MKERPILFSGPMVRAILDGRKTQTRRALRTQPHEGATGVHYDRATGGAMWASLRFDHGIACPYGVPGDRLWVRETWRWMCPDDPDVAIYRADGHVASTLPPGFKWKPSIFMPRRASRITLEITDVRVQRLQEISYEDALAEGAADFRGLIADECKDESPDECARRLEWPQREFRNLWDHINAKRAPWSDNPWCWAITFQVTPPSPLMGAR